MNLRNRISLSNYQLTQEMIQRKKNMQAMIDCQRHTHAYIFPFLWIIYFWATQIFRGWRSHESTTLCLVRKCNTLSAVSFQTHIPKLHIFQSCSLEDALKRIPYLHTVQYSTYIIYYNVHSYIFLISASFLIYCEQKLWYISYMNSLMNYYC